MPRQGEPDRLELLRTDIVSVLRDQSDIPDEVAMRMAAQILTALRTRYRGERLYISQDFTMRDQTVLRDFNGRNHSQVCRDNGISRKTLYRILHRAQKGIP